MKAISETLAAAFHAFAAWIISAAIFSLASWFANVTMAAIVVHAFAVPMAFGLSALAYFRRRTPLAPLPAAVWFGALFLLFEAIVARPLDPRAILLSTLLPAMAAVIATWLTGVAVTEKRGAAT
jgi:hypothetical protein